MYILRERPYDLFITKEGKIKHPIATLKNQRGDVAQIVVENGCYVLYIRRILNEHYTIATHWFNEAIKAVKEFPSLDTKRQMIMRKVCVKAVNTMVEMDLDHYEVEINAYDNITFGLKEGGRVPVVRIEFVQKDKCCCIVFNQRK